MEGGHGRRKDEEASRGVRIAFFAPSFRPPALQVTKHDESFKRESPKARLLTSPLPDPSSSRAAFALACPPPSLRRRRPALSSRPVVFRFSPSLASSS